MNRLHLANGAVYLCLLLIGCAGDPTKEKSSSAAKSYDVKGKVVDVAADKRAVTLDHEDIPGLMKAMTMKFQVEDPKVVEGIQSGDHVEGHLKVEGSKYIIIHLKKE